MTGKVNPLCYRIQKTQDSRSIIVHVDHLKSHGDEKPVNSWLTEGNQEQTESGPDGEQEEDNCQLDASVSDVGPSCSLDESVGNETGTINDAGQVNESKSDTQSLPVISSDTETFPNTYQTNKQTEIDSKAEPAPNLPTNPNSDLHKTLPDGRQQFADAPSLPNNPTSDLYNTLPYGSQQFVDASEPVTSTCPNPT